MLTGNLLRVRYAKQRILPYLHRLPTIPTGWPPPRGCSTCSVAGRAQTRGELEEDLADAFGDEGGQLVYRGLAKLLEDRCEFETVSGQPPELLVRRSSSAATESRRGRTACQ